MLFRSGIYKIKLVSVFIIICFSVSAVMPDRAWANSSTSVYDNLSPYSLFSSSLEGFQIKDIAMLEYVSISAAISDEVNLMTEKNDKDALSMGVDFGEEKVEMKFKFSQAFGSKKSGIRLVPCTIKTGTRDETDYLCCITKNLMIKSLSPYLVTFFTKEEQSRKDFIKKISEIKYAQRNEKDLRAILRARYSEKSDDEKIRKAFSLGQVVPVTVKDNSEVLTHIVIFLGMIAPDLAEDFMNLYQAGRVVIITSTGENELKEAHAGAGGIYLPNDPSYADPKILGGVIVHEVFAKAGRPHADCNQYQVMFQRYLDEIFSGEINVNAGDVFIEKIALSEKEKYLVDIAKNLSFIKDLTKIIWTRDYSEQDGYVFDADWGRLYFKKTHDPIWIIRLDETFIDVNPAFTRATGYAPVELRGRSLKDVVTEKSYAEIQQLIKLAVSVAKTHPEEARKSRTVRIEYRTKNNEVIPIESTCIFGFNDKKEPVNITGIMEDIVDIEGYSGIVEELNTGIYVSPLKEPGYFLQANPAVARMFGYTPEEILEIKIEDLYWDSKERKEFLDLIKKEGKVKDKILKMRKKDGTLILCECSASLKYNEQTKTTRIFGTLEDVTERQRAFNLIMIQNEIGRILSANYDFKETLQRILDVTCQGIDEIDAGGIYLVTGKGGLDLLVHKGVTDEFVREFGEFDSESPLTKFSMQGKPQYTRSGDVVNDIIDRARTIGKLKSIATVPILFGPDVYGLFNLASHDYDDISKHSQMMLETIASQIGGIIVRGVTEQARQESEENYRKLFTLAPTNMHTIDADGIIREVNDSWLDLFGYEREEVVGRSIFDFIHPADREKARERFERKKKGEKLPPKDRLYVAKSGRIIIGRTKDVFPESSDSNLKGISALIDYTEQRKAKKILREAEDRFRDMFEQSTIGKLFLDSEGKLVDANPAFLKGAGITDTREIKGLNVIEFIKLIYPEIREHLSLKHTVRFETPIELDKISETWSKKTKKEGTVYIDCRVTPLTAPSGNKKTGYLVHILDITKRKEAEKKLEQAYAELSQRTAQLVQAEKLSAIGEQSAAIAHEINNPVSNMMLTVDALLARLDSGESIEDSEIKKTLDRINRELERVAGLTDRFLGFARVSEEGNVPCSINKVLSEALMLTKKRIENNSITVITDFDQSSPVIVAGKDKIRQIFTNIMMNAIAAVKDKSGEKKIFLKTEVYQNEEKKYKVRIIIEDTGVGILEKDLDNIWKPFFSNRTDKSGTGLGLPLVKELVVENQGEIGVDSTPGVGTKFFMDFSLIDKDVENLRRITAREENNVYGSMCHDLNNVLGGMAYVEIILMNKDGLQPITIENLKALEKVSRDLATIIRVLQDVQAIKYYDFPPDKEIYMFTSRIMALISYIQDSEIPLLHAINAFISAKKIYDILNGVDMQLLSSDPSISEEIEKVKSILKGMDISQILDIINLKFNEVLQVSKNCIDNMPIEDYKTIQKRFDIVQAALQKFENYLAVVRKILVFEQCLDKHPVQTNIVNSVEEVVKFTRNSKRFFVENQVEFDENGLEINLRSQEEGYSTVGEASFKIAIFNILVTGLKLKDEYIDYQYGIRQLDRKNKKVKAKIELNNRRGELVISFINNFFQFTEEVLEERTLSSGAKGASIFDWRGDDLNTMALAYKLVSIFGGKIEIENNNDGSTIRVFIPQDKVYKKSMGFVKDATVETDSREDGFRKEPEKLLEHARNIIVVDDEEVQLSSWRDLLEDRFNVWVARNGLEAFRLIKEKEAQGIQFDLGIFDIGMPIMNGHTLINKVRQDGFTFPIIVSTGDKFDDSDFLDMKRGCVISEIISKTTRLAERLAVVDKYVGKKRASSEISIKTANKVALIYGNFQDGLDLLEKEGFCITENNGNIRHATTPEELQAELNTGEIDIIVNTTDKKTEDILKDLDKPFPIIDNEMSKDERIRILIGICA